METVNDIKGERSLINLIKLILEEKRSSLAVMRTGIVILVVQLFTLSILISTSKHYEFVEVKHMAIPFYIINAFLVVLAFYLITTSLIRIRHIDRTIKELKKKNGRIDELMR